MSFATANGVRHYYRLEGLEGRPVLVLSHSISTDHGMWEPQMPDLLRHFQVLRYDTRGHGASDSLPGDYSVEQLARDALALVDHLGIHRFAWCGLSMGGTIGQWLALHAPDRLTHLVLANTSARIGNRALWEARIKSVRDGGMAGIVDLAMHRFFSAKTLQGRDPHASSVRSVLLATNPEGYLGCCVALRDFDSTQQIKQISVPTLVIAGDQDVSTPWENNGEVLAHDIPNAKAVRLPAAHLSNIDQPRSFTAALLQFLLLDPRNSTDRGF